MTEEKYHPEIEALMEENKLSIWEVFQLRKMTDDAAESFMSERVFDEDIRKLLRQHIVGKAVTSTNTVPVGLLPQLAMHDKQLWRAVAYLSGASLQQIAEHEGVARSSVNDGLRRHLGRYRQQSRLSGGIGDDVYHLFHRVYKAQIASLRTKPPVEIAKWLMSNLEE